MRQSPATLATLVASRRPAPDPIFDHGELKFRATKFLANPALPGNRRERISEALASIDETGTYRLTTEERAFGCRLAWREYPGCIGRGSWRQLALIDLSDAP